MLHVIGSLQRHWATVFPTSIPTLYPGTRLETSSLPKWVEFWVDTWSYRRKRHSAPDTLRLAITVHCFTKANNDTTQLRQLVDLVQSALREQHIPITNAEAPTAPPLGLITILEPEVHDLSRVHAPVLRESLQHAVVTFRATAQYC